MPWGLPLTVLVVCLIYCFCHAADAQTAPARPPRESTRLLWNPQDPPFLDSWLICGEFAWPKDGHGEKTARQVAFDTDYLAEAGGESGIRPTAGIEIKRPDGSAASWRPFNSRGALANLQPAFPGRPGNQVVAYAYTTVHRKAAGKAVIGIGSDDGHKLFVNGKLVHSTSAYDRGAYIDDDFIEVDFVEGENRILLKIEQNALAWAFYMRVLESDSAAAQVGKLLGPKVSLAEGKIAITVSPPSADGATVQLRGPLGKVFAEQKVTATGPVNFDAESLAAGPYEVSAFATAADGRRVVAHRQYFHGDVLAAAKAAVESAAPAGLSDENAMLREMLIRLVRDRSEPAKLTAEPRVVMKHLNQPLMELAEIDLWEKGAKRLGYPSGFVRLAYRDPVDDAPQFCRVYFPPDYDPAKPHPLVVCLHGSSSARDYIHWGGSHDRHSPTADRFGAVVIWPHARGNSMYRGIGHHDVVRAIELTQQQFNIDPDRTYLIGYSMGGGGTWHVAGRRPELFAAVAPVFGGWDYRTSIPADRLAALSPWQQFHEEAASSFAQAESLLNVPVFVAQGEQDVQVDVEHARLAVRMMQRWGYPVRYWEQPGKGHALPEAENMLFPWLLSHQRDHHPSTVRLRAMDLKSGSAHWVSIQQRISPIQPVQAHASIVGRNQVSLTTENVVQITLRPAGPLIDPGRPLKVLWNHAPFEAAFADGAVTLTDKGYTPAKLAKTPAVEGPWADVYCTPFAIVEGTTAVDPLLKRLVQRRAEAEKRNRETRWQHPPRYFKDTELSDADLQRYSLILIGGPDANAVTRRLIDRLPLKIEPGKVILDGQSFDAPDSAVSLVYPHPLNPQRYVAVVAATSPAGMYFAGETPGDYDFMIADGRIANRRGGMFGGLGRASYPGSLVVGGYFDAAWRYDDAFVTRSDDAKPRLRKPPTLGTAAGDAESLELSRLLESGSAGAFGLVTRDTNARQQPITLAGKAYPTGLASGAPGWGSSWIEYDLSDASYRRLRGTIGLERDADAPDARRQSTAITFTVLGDDKELLKSTHRQETPPQELDLDIAGIETLRLQVTSESRGPAVDSVNWGSLRLER